MPGFYEFRSHASAAWALRHRVGGFAMDLLPYTSFMRCKGCHYSLANLTPSPEAGGGYRCPECGRAFVPDDPKTYTSTRRSFDPSEIPTTFLVAALLGSFGIPFLTFPQGSWRLWDVLNSAVISFLLTPFIFAIVLIAYCAIAVFVTSIARLFRRSIRADS
jgi:hypothetical protein